MPDPHLLEEHAGRTGRACRENILLMLYLTMSNWETVCVCVCVCVCVVVFAKSAVRLIDGHLRGLPEEQTEHATIKHGPQSQSS